MGLLGRIFGGGKKKQQPQQQGLSQDEMDQMLDDVTADIRNQNQPSYTQRRQAFDAGVQGARNDAMAPLQNGNAFAGLFQPAQTAAPASTYTPRSTDEDFDGYGFRRPR